MAKGRLPAEVLRSMQHLRPRTNVFSAVTRVRNCLAYAVHRFFQERGFYYIHTPLIASSDCEGAGEMFGVTTLLPEDARAPLPRVAETGEIDFKKDFFGKRTGLTVSGQLQVEAFCCSMADCYTFGPTFRAEVSHTTRHLSEFWMIEPEIAFADLASDMDLAEDFTKYLTAYVLRYCPEEIAFCDQFVEKGLRGRLQSVVDSPFVRITYAEAVRILSDPATVAEAAFENAIKYGDDLATEHERWLTEHVYRCPVFVTNWPKAIKAFYMRVDDGGETVSAMDLLVPRVGELIGGSAREERLDVLLERMRECHVEESELSWYVDLRRYGTCPHAGFGLGFERLIMYVTGVENIRDVIPFPRYPGHADI
jgi:asparaginyl-tRNA synthetase